MNNVEFVNPGKATRRHYTALEMDKIADKNNPYFKSWEDLI